MSERRLFAPELPAAAGDVVLPAESARHARVLRLEVGARVRLFDGRGHEARARVVAVARDAVRCESEPRERVEAPRPHVHVLLGLAKGAKLDGAVRMLAELGVHAVWPVVCARSVARPSATRTRQDARQERLERISLEACAQSGQSRAPAVHAPVDLEAAARQAPGDAMRLVFWEDAGADLDAAVASQPPEASELWIVVGPEGGLAAEEVERLGELGFAAVGLGAAKLRVETAVPVAVALAMDRVGRLRG